MAKNTYTFLPASLEELSIGSDTICLPVFESYTYSPLPGPRYIRLLHIEKPSADPSKLIGSLKVHKLEDDCDYEAISYTWGDGAELDRGMILDNRVLKITRNLYAALMALSYADRTRVLWADAICINQEDTAEKTQQVAIMADIYSRAKLVLAWVRPTSIAMMAAMNFIAQLAPKAKALGAGDDVGYPRFAPSFPSTTMSNEEARKLTEDAVEAHVDRLVSSSWFRRVWVVQEVTLAADVTVLCGISKVGWVEFARAIEVLRAALRQIPSDCETSIRLSGLGSAYKLVQQRDTFRIFDQYGERNHHLMATLLWNQMTHRDCSDDRDRVYAMLAMTKSPYAMIPDYTKTVAESFTEFTRRYSPLMHLHCAGLFRRKTAPVPRIASANEEDAPIDLSDRNYLPSWVPEFRPALSSGVGSVVTGTYSTATAIPFFFLPNPDVPNVMHVTGTLFDIVAFATLLHNSVEKLDCLGNPRHFFSLVNQLRFIIEERVPDGLYAPTAEPSWLAVAKALTGGVGDCKGASFLLQRYPAFDTLDFLEPGSVPWLTAIWQAFASHCLEPTGEVFQQILLKALGATPRPLSTQGVIARSFLSYLSNILDSYVLFDTRSGYIGLGPRYLREARCIVILNGCEMPYVVGYAGTAQHGDNVFQHTFQVVGSCYVHGIMKGEISSQRDASRFANLEWTRLDGDSVDSLEGWLALV